MSCSKHFAWVTHALCKEDAEAALVLGKSLRLSSTKGRLVVVTAPTLSSKSLKSALELTFDLVLPLKGENWEALKGHLSPSGLTSFYVLGLTCFEKCFILPPTSLTLKNPDWVFEEDVEKIKGGVSFLNGLDNPVFVEPSLQVFKEIEKELKQVKKDLEEDGRLIERLVKLGSESTFSLGNQNGLGFASVGLNDIDHANEKHSIVHLKDLAQYRNGNEAIGENAKRIYKLWKNLFENSGLDNQLSSSIESTVQLKGSNGFCNEPIAIIGMSCRLPMANNLGEFWELLEGGKDAIRSPPAHRFTKEQYPYLPRGIEKIEAGFLSVPIDEFDAKFFEVSPKDAVCMDPQHRLLMELVWECFEDAAINPQELRGAKGGVFVGDWLNGYKEILHEDPSTSDFYRIYKGNCIGVGAATASHALGFTGPCNGAESDCSAGLTSVHMACTSLRNEQCNIALACGVNLLVRPFTGETVPALFSSDYRCKTFDEGANGFARAEGVGILLLKRYSDAKRDGDQIWGLIRGTSMNQEGLSPSMGTPTVPSQVEAMQLALNDGGIHPGQVSYVEAHGTGTSVGDFVEMQGIAQVYGGSVERDDLLTVGSVKTNLGHTESCSGITSMIKVILSMKNQLIPPHINFKKLNPKIDLEGMKARLPLEAVSWPKIHDKPRFAGVSSFGVAGNNSHVILEEAPGDNSKKHGASTFERPVHIMKVTAKTEMALDDLLKKYEERLQETEFNFGDVAHTANVGRADFNCRAVLIAEDSCSALNIIKSGEFQRNELSQASGNGDDSSKQICFLFTGQGSQYHSMGKQLYETSPVFKLHFDFCNEWLLARYNFSLKKAYFENSEDDINRTLFSQTGIFVVEYCLMKLWQSWGVKPSSVIGHSLGEFCAAVCAGILDVEDALTLVAERSRLIDQLPVGKMLVIKADQSTVDNLQNEFFAGSEGRLDYAAFNAEDQTVVAGCPETILGFQKFLKEEKGVKCTLLQSSHAFHSRDMDPILKEYGSVAEGIKINEAYPETNYISGMLGKKVDQLNANYWIRHTREPVNFLKACKVITEELECPTYLEIGPHPILSAFVMMNNSKGKNLTCLPSLRRNTEDWKTIFSSVGKLYVDKGVEINWKGLDEGYSRTKIGSSLPTYPFQRTKFWPRIPSHLHQHSASHPLLGSKLSSPISSRMAFQSSLAASADMEYLKDHMLDEMIVFPGAGYIEMILAAGSTYFFGRKDHQFQHPSRPIQIKDLKISAPLQLDYEEGSTCQTILETERKNETDKEGEEGFHSIIYHQQKNAEQGESWVRHASAHFFPHDNILQGTGEEVDEEHLRSLLQPYCRDPSANKDLFNSFKSSREEESLLQIFYERYSTIGLIFGDTFRTLLKVWKCRETREILAEVEVPEQEEKYLVHPTLIDTLVQAAGFPHFDTQKKPQLLVPVGCKRFIWMKPLKTQKCFVYVPNTDLRSALLFDQDGDLVALLYKIELVPTNVENIRAILDTRPKSLPQLYKTEWKKAGDLSTRFDLGACPDGVYFAKKSSQHLEVSSEDETEQRKDVNRLAALYITKALQTLGWSPKKSERFPIDEIAATLGIQGYQVMLLKHLLTYLEMDGLIKTEGSDYVNIETLPSMGEIETEIDSLVSKHCPLKNDFKKNSVPLEHVPILLFHSLGEKLDKFLTAEESALPYLYPKDDSSLTAARYYEKVGGKMISALKPLLEQQWKAIQEAHEGKNDKSLPTLRLLEIGAGTGACSSTFLQTLDEAKIPFEYVYTDLSTAFFSSAETKFENYVDRMKFRKLDIEKDPTSQGFPPKYFDVVVASHVVHATSDIREALQNVRMMMRDGGNFWMIETIGMDRMSDCLFALLEGFWLFTDFELRPTYCMLSGEKWNQVTKETGFSDFHCVPVDNGTFGVIACKAGNDCTSRPVSKRLEAYPTWVIFHGEEENESVAQLVSYFEEIGRKNIVLVKVSSNSDTDFANILKNNANLEGIIVTWGLTETERDQDKLAKPYLQLLQALMQFSSGLDIASPPPLALLTKGQFPIGDITCSNPSPSTIIGMTLTTMNERKEMKLRVIDLDNAFAPATLWQAFQEILTGFEEEMPLVTVFRGEKKFHPKFTTAKVPAPSLALPSATDRFQLELPSSRLIQDLKFQPLEPYHLEENEIEVRVVSSALNFLDVLSIIKPTEIFNKFNQVGVDFAGVITGVGPSVTKLKVGDSVFGFNAAVQALPSHVKLEEDWVQRLPPSFTFGEGACLPTVFATAYYSLVDLANAQKGETLLVHTASGGVGLAAVQIAKELGLKLICTAGSERKRAYLRNLGLSHVFNSRNTNYSKKIMEITEGKGVDIVLNSLTSPGFKEATLEASCNGARFIEMSKMNVWSVEEVKALRPDIMYSFIDLSKQGKDFGALKSLLVTLSDWMKDGKIKPIPFTRFDAGDIREAITYLQETKHVGKVVLAMPESGSLSGRKQGQIEGGEVALFNEKSTYLITGGLGGIGLEVCKYMLEQEARHIVLVGRSPPSPAVSLVLEGLRKQNSCTIVVLQGDVGSWEDCKLIFKTIASSSLPPLRGVMHSAGTLSDGMMQNLKWEDFQKTYRSKVQGSWNLHELTKDLPLEHFVLYASVAGKFAFLGQASHGSACNFQDTLAHYRNSQGLPATTIDWGQWGEVGVAKDLEMKIVYPFNARQGINALDLILRKNLNAITVVNIRDNLATQIGSYPYMKWVIDPKVLKQSSDSSSLSSGNKFKVNSVKFWEDYESCGNSTDGKISTAKKYVELMLRTVLRFDSSEPINEEVDLSIMGMDSLMMIELFNLMQEAVGKKIVLSQAAIRDCKTLKALVQRFVEVVDERWKEIPPPSIEEVRKQSQIDAELPEDIQQENPGSHVAPSKIKTLLLTGATGVLGTHLLKELLEGCPQLERIYCLVRGDQPLKRLLTLLEKNRVTIPTTQFEQKCCVISGDFTEPQFGLPEGEYAKLCNEVDAIFHSGASVNHYEYYRNIPGSSKDIQSVNVGGVLNVLRFACKSKTKHVFHASSSAASWEEGEDGLLHESWLNLEKLSTLETNMGYPVSKIINELHLEAALKSRGVPVKVLRYQELRGSTASTGKSFFEGSHTMRMAIFCLKEGVIPKEPFPLNIIPVDVAAKITTELVFKDDAPNDVYNVSHPRCPMVKNCFPQLAEELGYPTKSAVTSEEFAQRVVERCVQAKKDFEKDGKTSSLRKTAVFELQHVYQDKNLYKFFLNYAKQEKPEHFWASRKLQKWVPEVYNEIESPVDILKRDLKAAISEGFMDLI